MNNENQLYFFEGAIIKVIIQSGVWRLSLLKSLAISESLWLFLHCPDSHAAPFFSLKSSLPILSSLQSPSLTCSLFLSPLTVVFVFLFSWRTLLLILVWHQTLSYFVLFHPFLFILVLGSSWVCELLEGNAVLEFIACIFSFFFSVSSPFHSML